MKVFLSYIRLVRPFNLIMILLTLYMVRLFLFYPQPHLPVNEVTYALFSLSFICMAAGGYIINDYYDVEIDKINKAGRVIVGNALSLRSVLTAYWIISTGGVITGFLSCYLAGVPLLGILFLFYLAALWFYSYKLKSTFLLGNILIGVCIALVPLAGACIELYANAGSAAFKSDEKTLVWELIAGIAAFAFLSTLIREIVKDAEDMEGDATAGCHTMPIVTGIKKTRWIIFSLIFLLNGLLAYAQYAAISLGIYPFLYFLFFIQVPLIIIAYKLLKANGSTDFHKMSTWLKALMLTGTIYVFFLAFEVYLTYRFVMIFFNPK